MARPATAKQAPVFNASTLTKDFTQKTIPRLPGRRVINPVQLPWHEGFLNRLSELTKLPKNWDGYGAGPVSFHVANFAASMVSSACPHHVQEPQVVPGSNGDLQVEWHSLEYDVELQVLAPYQVHATRYFDDECEEMDLTNDFTTVAAWLDDLENAIAARTAAA
jgi:hypothetical protein